MDPCSCWITPPGARRVAHAGHCCWHDDAPAGCHDDVLAAADEVTGSRAATLALAGRTRVRLLAEIIATRYPRSA